MNSSVEMKGNETTLETPVCASDVSLSATANFPSIDCLCSVDSCNHLMQVCPE